MNTVTSRIWILGASDPEMSAIETILRECGERVIHATIAGRRVSAGEAYRAETPRDDLIWLNGEGTIYAVECDWEHRDGETGDVSHLDHHRPGDRGYMAPPDDYWGASSIGQVWTELSRLGLLSGDPGDASESRLVAAADHCLAHAYAGQCPGIDPDRLLLHRVSSQVAFRRDPGVTVESILADIDLAHHALLAAPDVVLSETLCDWHAAGHRRADDCLTRSGREYSSEPCQTISARDMRGRHVPSLPDAGTRYGIPYIADGLPGPDGRTKIVCSGPSEVVRAFLSWATGERIVDCYGDPERGFAGGYLTSTSPEGTA
jgi:hypothetical protein